MESAECRDCGEIYLDNQGKCPKCGSLHKIKYISVSESLVMDFELTGMEGRNPHLPSKKKLRWKWINQNKVQRGDGVTPIHHYQFFDKDSDKYEEVVTNLDTGEIIRDCKEPLSAHRGHGSDKK